MTADFSPSIDHLQLLGYEQDEPVYYRAIADKPRKLSAKFPDIPLELSTLNDEGFNIFVVVNGGGDKDADVITCKAIFYEHDNLPKEDQLYLWQSLGLPEPTFQVDTGGKSIHSYWVFDEPIAVDLWKILQTDLLNFSDADRTVKNPSRVMRLAGFKHQKTGELASIVSKSGTRYSYDELRALVPPTPVVVEETKPKQKQDRKLKIVLGQESPTPKAASGIAIPLENCLAHSNRDLLGGVSEGGRNDSGATLARDLIGTANYLDSIGTLYIGDARSLFDGFCSRCNPPLDASEADTIWDSAQRDNPEPSCPPDAIANILNSWYKEHDPHYVEPREERKLGYYTSPHESLVYVHMGKDADGEPHKVNTRIGNHLEAIAVVDNPEQDQSALLLEFKTFQGHIRRVVILRSDLAGDGTAIISMLMGLGYAFKRKLKTQLLDYLHGLGIGISKKYTVTESTGWVNKSFVMPHKTYGDVDLRFRDIDPSPDVITEIKGSLTDWQDNIGSKCAGNSRLIFALGVAFAALLSAVVGLESGGFHLVGGTSQGKTTTLKVAASVIGERQIQSWRTTVNGLEAIATAHNNLLLLLDEIVQAEAQEVGKAAYMLGNGQSKARMNKNLTNRKVNKWNLLFLSSGEVGMAAYLSQAGIVQKGGQEVRLCDIPAVPFGSLFGVFENIHGAGSSKQFAQELEAATEKYRGTAIDAFLTRLVSDRSNEFDSELTSKHFAASRELAKDTTDHAVSRVANRFALVQVALELAHSYGILPVNVKTDWDNNIKWAVKKMFSDWLTNRGGDGSIEIKQACDRIEHLIISNEFSDRVYDPRKADGQVVRNLLGHKVSGFDNEFLELLVPTQVFDREFCQGVDKKALIAELQSRGWLEAPGADGRSNLTRNVKGKKIRVYVFLPNAVQDYEKSLEPPKKHVSEIDFTVYSIFQRFKMLEVRPGDIIIGKSGKSLKVDRVEGDLLICGDRKIGIGAVVRVENPDVDKIKSAPTPITKKVTQQVGFKLGDRVEYIGNDFNLKTQYVGTLEIWEMGKLCDSDKCACLKPNGRVTSWIEFSDLQLVNTIEPNPSMALRNPSRRSVININ